MENASKALIIAGAILLVIAIIAIAVGIVSRTRGAIDTAGNQIDSMAIEMHNKMFSIDEEYVTGEYVKEYIAKVLAYNNSTKNKDMQIEFVLVDTDAYHLYFGAHEEAHKELSSELSLLIGNSTIYKVVDTITNSSGIIFRVRIKEQ